MYMLALNLESHFTLLPLRFRFGVQLIYTTKISDPSGLVSYSYSKATTENKSEDSDYDNDNDKEQNQATKGSFVELEESYSYSCFIFQHQY